MFIVYSVFVSSFLQHSPPHPANPCRNQKRRARKQHNTSIRPEGRESSLFQNRSTNWCADQEADGYDAEALPKSRADLVSCLHAEGDDNAGRQADKRAREEAVEGHEDGDARRGTCRDEACTEDGGHDSAGNDNVDGSEFVAEEIGYDT